MSFVNNFFNFIGGEGYEEQEIYCASIGYVNYCGVFAGCTPAEKASGDDKPTSNYDTY